MTKAEVGTGLRNQIHGENRHIGLLAIESINEIPRIITSNSLAICLEFVMLKF